MPSLLWKDHPVPSSIMHLLNNSSEHSLVVGLQYPLFTYLKTCISELHVHHIQLLASNAGDLESLHAPPEVYALFFVGSVCCFSFFKFAIQHGSSIAQNLLALQQISER